MARQVVRQDVVQISVESADALTALAQMQVAINTLRDNLIGITSDTDMGGIGTQANRASDALGDAARQAQGLGENINNTSDGLDDAARQAQGLGDSLGDTEEQSRQTERQTDRTRNSMRELASLSFTQLNSGLNRVSEHLTNIAKKAVGAVYTGLKRLASISFKALAVGVGAVGAAIGMSVSAYADYEQLLGGVETLFGAKGAKSVQEYAKLTGKSVSQVQSEYNKLIKSQNLVVKNANNAYKEAGLSANDYMETVTGFSASLLQSLNGDTQKTAEYAHIAITDMADNANKMGTDMASIQYAYQGFAKQNYTIILSIVRYMCEHIVSVCELYQRCGNKISQEMVIEMFLLTGKA